MDFSQTHTDGPVPVLRLVCSWCGALLREATSPEAATSHGICRKCASVLERDCRRGSTPPQRNLDPPNALGFVEERLNEMMCKLYESREALRDLQKRIGDNGRLLGAVGRALASVRHQEKALAEIQRRIAGL